MARFAPGRKLDFLQSVDYRYTLHGQLSSINNAELNSAAATNDETNDYFGMQFLYNALESGLNNVPAFNGNISAVKWKAIGADEGATEQKSYNYEYDHAGKLLSAAYKVSSTTGWDQEAGALNEAMTYDRNGNIATLARAGRSHVLNGVIASYTAESIDALTYTYDNIVADRLDKVQDAATARGFNNGNSGTSSDFTYDGEGNLTADENKGIDGIQYNFLGKVSRIEFTDGRIITYDYDASGNKIKQRLYEGTTLQNTTDYVDGFVYENDNLSFFGSPEGRVVKNGNSLEYQYAIADHQGNTRVVFSSVTQPPKEFLATFENPATDNLEFDNVPSALPYWASFTAANHTPSGIKVVRMNQDFNIGPAKSLKVYPGDKVDMEVWTYYENSSGFGTSSPVLNTLITAVAGAFGGVSGGSGEQGAIYNGVDGALTAFGTGGNRGDAAPGAYLNYILFDKDYNVLDMGWTPATGYNAQQKISIDDIAVTEPGYIFVYLSYENESGNFVQFDDFKVTHTMTNVIQYNEYYPFGLQASTSWTRENHKNNYLYNAGNELNENNGLYETFFRGYDPALGRFLQLDPLASMYGSHSGYNYALNNPVLFNDPMGDRVISELPDYIDQSVWDGGGYRRNGPGSGNHWTDQHSNPYRDYFLMSGSNFEAKYGASAREYGQWHAASRRDWGRPTGTARYAAVSMVGNKYGTWVLNDGKWIDMASDEQLQRRNQFESQQGDPYPTDKYYQLPEESSREPFGAVEYFWSGGIENGIKYDQDGVPMVKVAIGMANVGPSKTGKILYHLHHYWPKFLGGPKSMRFTTKLTADAHRALHRDLNAFLKPYGMAPSSINTGAMIRNKFSPQEIINTLKAFYNGPGAKYIDAAKDFLNHIGN